MSSFSKQPAADKYVIGLIEASGIARQRSNGREIGKINSFNVVLDGKRYNTDAEGMELVTDYTSTDNEFGNYWADENLWKTAKGNWALAGTGGDATPWCDFGRDWCGYAVIPLTRDQAMRYLQMRGFAHLIGDHFDVEEA